MKTAAPEQEGSLAALGLGWAMRGREMRVHLHTA